MLTKTKGFLVVDVKKEFPDGECCMISENGEMLVGYPADVNGEVQADDEHQILLNIKYWLKEQEGYFFTEAELKEHKEKMECLVNYLKMWNENKPYIPDELPKIIKEAEEYINNLFEEKQFSEGK